jgi:anti-sigma factor RsiW
MKHREIEELIQKGLDREISPRDKDRLDKHLAGCPECAEFYREMMHTTDAVRKLTEFYPQAGFNSRVISRLGLRRRLAWTKAGLVLVGGWLAAAVFAAYSPLPAELLGKIATSVPALVRFCDKTAIVVSSLTSLLTPVVKNSFSAMGPVIGLVFSILFIYFLGKTLQKEAKCRT